MRRAIRMMYTRLFLRCELPDLSWMRAAQADVKVSTWDDGLPENLWSFLTDFSFGRRR